jgi:hypothetical protein
MGKAARWFATVSVALLGVAISADVAAQGRPRYLILLWAAVVIASTLFALCGSVHIFLKIKGFLNAIELLDDWRCTYWQAEQQLKVTLWFVDRSDATRYSAECWAQFGQDVIPLEEVDLGGTYLGRRRLVSGKQGPIMAEFLKREVKLESPERATILVRIKPVGWWKGAARERASTLSVQVIKR